MTAAERILQKALVASSIPSSQWTGIQAALRDRAFFSSKIESMRYLYEARRTVADMLAERKTERGTIATREDAIRTIRERGASLGLAPEDPMKRGGLQDPTSRARAAVIVDTNAGLAAGYVRQCEDMSLGARLLYPCKELVRAPGSNPKKPRDWAVRWENLGGKLYNGRMIALVEDGIWSKISRFGSPYPPFDYNSGMITVSVGRDEAESLGVIQKNFKPEKKPIQEGFNDRLSVEMPYSPKSTDFENLKKIFGDQIAHDGRRIYWKAKEIREKFEDKKPFSFDVGVVTQKVRDMLSPKQRSILGEKVFEFQNKWRKEHGTYHFGDEETRKDNIPLTAGDLEMVPSLWRDPDRISEGGTASASMHEIDTLDGGTLVAIFDLKGRNGKALIKTLYKKKRVGGVPDTSIRT